MFTLTLRLKPSKREEERLYKLMRTYAHSNNVMISHARKCLNNLHSDIRYNELLQIYKQNGKFTSSEKTEIGSIIKSYGLSKFDFKKYLCSQNEIHKYTNTRILQSIADRTWQAVESVLYENGVEIDFVNTNNFLSFEGNDNKTGVYFKNGLVHVSKMKIKPYIRHNDTYAKEALKNEIKMCRIKRRWHKHKWRYYVDIVLDGDPPKKHKTANGTVGIEIGPTTIAVDSENGSFFEELAKDIKTIDSELKIINRKLNRQRRANNPDNYNENGITKRNTKTFKKKWKKSYSQLQTIHRRRELYRLRKDKIGFSHHILANRVLELGNKVFIKDMQSYALVKQIRYKNKSNKCFNETKLNYEPSNFVKILERKLESSGGELIKVDCLKTATTQFDSIPET